MSGHAQVILVPREGFGTQVAGHHDMHVVPRGALSPPRLGLSVHRRVASQ